MLGTTAVSWFACISVLAGSQAGDNIEFRSGAGVDGDCLLVCSYSFLSPHYCACILLLATPVLAFCAAVHIETMTCEVLVVYNDGVDTLRYGFSSSMVFPIFRMIREGSSVDAPV